MKPRPQKKDNEVSQVSAQEPIDSRAYVKARTRAEAFMVMLRAAVRDGNVKAVYRVISEWWIVVFGVRSLPVGLVNVNDISVMIRYALLHEGYSRNGIIPSHEFLYNYEWSQRLIDRPQLAREKIGSHLFDYEQLGSIGQATLQIAEPDEATQLNQKEAVMATQKTASKKSTKSSTINPTKEAPKVTTVKALPKAPPKALPKISPKPVKSDAEAKKVPKKAIPAKGQTGTPSSDSTSKKKIAGERKKMCAELLFARKMTDEQIIDAVNKAYPGLEPTFHKGRIATVRAELKRKDVAARFGVPMGSYPPIHGEEK